MVLYFSFYVILFGSVILAILLRIYPALSILLQMFCMRMVKRCRCFQCVRYNSHMSPMSVRQLSMVQRKMLVLDLDETLVHSRIIRCKCVRCQLLANRVPFDCVFEFTDNGGVYTVGVLKRPHVDFFLDVVSRWYDLVVYTAATAEYADVVLDFLDKGRGILLNRYYRQHCVKINGLEAKLLTTITNDMANTLIVDNSPITCVFNPDNSIGIRTFKFDQGDTELLSLLPILDALRFTQDVRSVLGRNRLPCV